MKEGTNTFRLTCRTGVVSERASAQYFPCGMPCCHLGLSREEDRGEQKICPVGWTSVPYVCKSKRVTQCTNDCSMAHSAIKTEKKKKKQLIYFCKRESLNVISAQTCNYFGNQN